MLRNHRVDMKALGLVLSVLVAVASTALAEPWDSTFVRAERMFQAKQIDSAIILGKLALQQVVREVGRADTATAKVADRIGWYCYNLELLDSAEVYIREGLRIREAQLGPDHLQVSFSLNNLGTLLRKRGRYEGVEAIYLRALAIKEKSLPENDPDIANSLNSIGNLYWDQGRYPQAEMAYKRALSIRKASLSPKSLQIATSLHNLGLLLVAMGNFREAESLYQQALLINETATGTDRLKLAVNYNSLATLYNNEGDYSRAKPLYEKALAIRKEILGPSNSLVAEVLDNLGNICSSLGQYTESEVKHQEALRLREEKLGPDHPEVARSLHNIAWLRRRLNDYAGAEACDRRALLIRQRAFGEDSPVAMRTLNNLAADFMKQGKFAAAESIHVTGLALRIKSLGADHPDVGQSLTNLANVCVKLKQYSRADSLYARAVALFDQSLGAQSEKSAEALEFYSDYLRIVGRKQDAADAAYKAVLGRHANFLTNSKTLSEKDALTYASLLRYTVDLFLSCVQDLGFRNQALVTKTADVILANKGGVSDQIFERQRSLVEESDSLTTRVADEYRLCTFQLSRTLVDGPGADLPVYQRRVDSLTRAVNDVETRLADLSLSFRERKQNRAVDSRQIARQLESGAVLIEYLKYSYRTPGSETGSDRYLVMKLGHDGAPALADLGAASRIDSAVTDCRRHFNALAEKDHAPLKRDKSDYQIIADKLYTLLIAPVEKSISEGSLVLIAPDGALNLVSFAALIDGEGRYLIEKAPIHYLSAGRELARLNTPTAVGRGLLAMGDPDYDNGDNSETAVVSQTREETYASVAARTRGNERSSCEFFKGMKIDKLPWTRKEIESVGRSWQESQTGKVITLLGAKASEGGFKSLASGKRVIHLATHGYYISDECGGLVATGREPDLGQFVSENPLLQSGLFFAGANVRDSNDGQQATEDGVLTAAEVSALNLHGTALVVLSACETGLGKIEKGEGVYGLRRAFQTAGVRTVVSALWQVPDRETAAFMAALYASGYRSLSDKMREIQIKRIRELRSGRLADHPYSWGAFIAIGAWR